MINLLPAATSTPKHPFKTSELVSALRHKLSPELTNTINNLDVEQSYSTLENYPEFLIRKAGECAQLDNATARVNAARKCIEQWPGDASKIGLLIAATNTPDQILPCLASEVMGKTRGLSRSIRTVSMQAEVFSITEVDRSRPMVSSCEPGPNGDGVDARISHSLRSCSPAK